MDQVIDSSVWIDYLRTGTAEPVRRIADAVINDPQAVLCEQVVFELRRGASKKERQVLLKQLSTIPVLSTPSTLWTEAWRLGETATDSGLLLPSLDLLIAAVCIHHGVVLTTFDSHFLRLAKVSRLQVNLLSRSVKD